MLKELLKEKNIAQEEFAKKMKKSQQAISNWVTGKNQPKLSVLKKYQ